MLLESNATDANRLDATLGVIATRLELVTLEEERRLLQDSADSWRKFNEHLQQLLPLASERLAVDQAMLDDAAARVDESKSRAQKLERLAQRRHTAGLKQDGASTIEKQIAAARLLGAEATAAEAQAVATRYTLQQAYLEARLAPDDTTLGKLRDVRDQALQTVKTLDDQTSLWREVAARDRKRALLSKSDTDTEVSTQARTYIDIADDTIDAIAQIDIVLGRINFIEKQSAALLASAGGQASDLAASLVDKVQNGWSFVQRWGDASLFEINETPVTPLGLFRVIVILTIAIWISKFVRVGLEKLLARGSTMSRSSVYMLGRIFHYLILAAAVLIALSSIGLDFTKLAFIAGALGVGIGFGLQAIFSNFISGIIVLLERSLKVGDFVELESGVTGEVREINIRSTLITTNDNVDILVPNSEFVNSRVINWTHRDVYRRVHIPFGVAYGTDKDLVRDSVLNAASDVPHTLKLPGRDPKVWLVEFGDSSLNFELVVWLTPEAVVRPGAVHADYMWAIETALGDADIEIPFPQRDLNIRSFFGKKDDDGFEWFDQGRRDPDRT